MASRSERLERLLTQEGGCSDADIESRIQTLEGYASDISPANESDLTALQTLGNDTRYTITRLLVAADRELCVCELTSVVDVSDSAISHALSDLYDAGLVTRRKDGTWRYYEATERAMAVLDALDTTRDTSQ